MKNKISEKKFNKIKIKRYTLSYRNKKFIAQLKWLFLYTLNTN